MTDTTTNKATPPSGSRYKHRDAILDILTARPGLCCDEITGLIGGVPLGTISSTLSGLEEIGVLRSEKETLPRAPGKHRRRLYSIRKDGEPLTPPSNRHAKTVTLPAGEFEELRKQIANLEAQLLEAAAWTRDAVARYPDLRIDPLLLEARRIVVEAGNVTTEQQVSILDGDHDDSIAIRAVLSTLRRAQQSKEA